MLTSYLAFGGKSPAASDSKSKVITREHSKPDAGATNCRDSVLPSGPIILDQDVQDGAGGNAAMYSVSIAVTVIVIVSPGCTTKKPCSLISISVLLIS